MLSGMMPLGMCWKPQAIRSHGLTAARVLALPS
jgi:hypothetical protein